MISRRFVAAGLGSLITVIVSAGFVGEAFAGETACLADSSSGSKPASRVASDAGGDHPSSNSRLLANQAALTEVKEVEELRKAAKEGDALAQLNLGLCYGNGRGVTKDTALAITWFRTSAEQGFAEAQYTLGCCRNGDDGFPKDSNEAVKWWERAASQGHADAQYCLGLSYSVGEGVAKDPAEAAKWWKKAAVHNHADAQYFLGISYSIGLGVPKIEEQAIYWLRKAAANGNENALAALKRVGKDYDIQAGP